MSRLIHGICTFRNKVDKVEEEYIVKVQEKLKHYEDLEEDLAKLFDGRMSIETLVNDFIKTVRKVDGHLDFARILTNKEAEDWVRWRTLNYEDRLIELPCKVGDTVWWRNYENIFEPLTVIMFEITEPGITRIVARTEHCDYRYFSMDAFELGILKTTKDEDEAKLAELKGGGGDV